MSAPVEASRVVVGTQEGRVVVIEFLDAAGTTYARATIATAAALAIADNLVETVEQLRAPPPERPQ